MRVAIISDIHGNLISLNAVLEDIEQQAVDQIVCLGDVAATGPQPHEVVQRLRALNCPVIMGNTDEWLLHPTITEDADPQTAGIERIDLWCAAQLTEGDREFLAGFPPTYTLALSDAIDVLCFHGSPHSHSDILRATTPEDEVARMLDGFHATIMIGGHTHEVMIRRYRDMLLVNPGSVGLPYERDAATNRAYNPPWAEYAVIDGGEGRLAIELRRVAVDAEEIARMMRASGIPHPDWFWNSGSVE
jgi:putative phosphoesterase